MKNILNFKKCEENDSFGVDYLLDKIYKKDINSLYKFEKNRLDNFSNEDFNYKEDLINNINNFVINNNNNIISISDLNKDIILISKLDGIERHEITYLKEDEFIAYIFVPSDIDENMEYCIQKYNLNYSNLSIKILEDINMLLEDEL